ncbi:MAG TPA: type II CRISPR-associated endonuclease Cas1 [Devosia sp.]|nr:type II CRISPR-associated endonuclease Cas1 [Devosia sp.]
MQNRVIDISSDGAHLSVSRGFLSVKVNGETAGKVAIDDISALIIRGHGASLSVNICARLSRANVPIVICGSNQSPASVIWPVSGHFTQGLHMQAQAVANKPLLKRLWAQLVKAKITAQADVLEAFGLNGADIRAMAERTKSGDSDNQEAQAARRYWPRLMGETFRRDRQEEGANAALNYGYTILRAASARAILAAGLHPSLSLHHQSRGDALRLADDLMEPFRPFIDQAVRQMRDSQARNEELQLNQHTKAALVGVLSLDLNSAHGSSPMQLCMGRMAQSLVRVFLGEEKIMELPGAPLPLVSDSQGQTNAE